MASMLGDYGDTPGIGIVNAGGPVRAINNPDGTQTIDAIISHRTGTLSYLLGIVGVSGELAVATDYPVIVGYDVGGVGKVQSLTPIAVRGAKGDTPTLASSTASSVLILDTANFSDTPTSMIDSVNNSLIPDQSSVITAGVLTVRYEVSAEVQFAYAAAPGTLRRAVIQKSINGLWSDLVNIVVAPTSLGTTPTTVIRFPSTILDVQASTVQFRVKAAQDSGSNMAVSVLSLVAKVSLPGS